MRVEVNQSITNHPDEFTCSELEAVTAVFKSLETGLRQGTIFPKVRPGWSAGQQGRIGSVLLSGSTPRHHEAGAQPHRPGDCGHL